MKPMVYVVALPEQILIKRVQGKIHSSFVTVHMYVCMTNLNIGWNSRSETNF